MEPFSNLKSKPVPLDIVNVDTDQIIPKQFLKLLGKTGYEKYLFYNWRYDKDGNEWLVHSTKKGNVGDKIGLDFEPEAIHVMRLGETEEEFDKRLESYGDDPNE